MGRDEADAVGTWAVGQRERVNRLIEAARAVVGAWDGEERIIHGTLLIIELRTAVDGMQGDEGKR
jgi:hypothetical protein